MIAALRLRAPARSHRRRRRACCSSPTATSSSSRRARPSATRCRTPRSASCSVGGDEPTRWDHVFATHPERGRRDLARALRRRALPARRRRRVPPRPGRRPTRRVVPHLRPDILRRPDRDARAHRRQVAAARLRRPHRRRAPPVARARASAARAVRVLRHLRRHRPAPRALDAQRLRRRRARRRLHRQRRARRSRPAISSQRRVADLRAIRALGFCVSVEHAEFMAERFTAPRHPALAVHGDSPTSPRRRATPAARARGQRALHVRPLQRGRRPAVRRHAAAPAPHAERRRCSCSSSVAASAIHPDKTSCLVLDFIGQHRDEFRFDAILVRAHRASRARACARPSRTGFPFLPSGCALQLDAVAREQILRSLRATLGGRAAPDRRAARAVRRGARHVTLAAVPRRRPAATLDDVYARRRLDHAPRARRRSLDGADADDDDLSRPARPAAPHRRARRACAPIATATRRAASSDVALTDRDVACIDARVPAPPSRRRCAPPRRPLPYSRDAAAIVDELDAAARGARGSRRARRGRLPRPGVAARAASPLLAPRDRRRRRLRRSRASKSVSPRPASSSSTDSSASCCSSRSTSRARASRRRRATATTRSAATLFHWETQAAASVTRPVGTSLRREPGQRLDASSCSSAPIRTRRFAFLGPVRYESHAGRSPDRDHVAPATPDARRALRPLRNAPPGLTAQISRIAGFVRALRVSGHGVHTSRRPDPRHPEHSTASGDARRVPRRPAQLGQ